MVILTPSTKKALAGIIPGPLIGLVCWILIYHPHWLPTDHAFVAMAPYGILVVTATLALAFKRSLIFFAVLVVTLAYGLLDSVHSQAPHGGDLFQLALSITGLLLPLNLLTVFLQRERNQVVSLRNLLFVSILGLQFAAVSFWNAKSPDTLHSIVMFPLYADITLPTWLTLPVPAALALLGGSAAALILCIRRFSIIQAAFFWLMAGIGTAYFFASTPIHLTILVSISVLILMFGLLQTWHDVAYLDELTQLPGRMALNEMVNSLRGDYVVAMLDVDFFKRCNDNYGHDVGDQILKMVASKMLKVSGGGKPFRYGGEEFAIVFPGKRTRDVFIHLSDVREAIEDTRLILRDYKTRPTKKPDEQLLKRKNNLRYISVTISIGIAERNDENDTAGKVFKAADEALYRAKERGRNRLSF